MNYSKLTTVQKAVSEIPDNAIIAFNGIGIIGCPEQFFIELEKRFGKTHHPKGLTILSACGLGSYNKDEDYMDKLNKPDMVNCIITGHLTAFRSFFSRIKNNTIEAYNLSQGIISMNYREAAARRPGFYSKAGLHTFLDSRHQGAAVNEISKKKLVEVREENGEEYLFYHTIFPDVCVIRGTTADVNGNITSEKEISLTDSLELAMAVHNNGGKVFVQVERTIDVPHNPKDVQIPSQLIDAIWVSPNQKQSNLQGDYSPYYCGKLRAPKIEINELCKQDIERISPQIAERIIARRAALEMTGCKSVNMGIGIPLLVPTEAQLMGISSDDSYISIDTGSMGGIPVPDLFGASLNPDAIYNMASQFAFYEGGALDLSLVGAFQVDKNGNVNVVGNEDTFVGIGGFDHVTLSAKKIIICSRFRVSSGFTAENNTITINHGRADKFVEEIKYISLNAKYLRSLGKEIKYITERGVFEFNGDNLVLTEVIPGVNPRADIFGWLPFPVEIAEFLRPMPAVCYDFNAKYVG